VRGRPVRRVPRAVHREDAAEVHPAGRRAALRDRHPPGRVLRGGVAGAVPDGPRRHAQRVEGAGHREEGLEEEKAVRIGVQALLEVVDSGAKNMEICVVRLGGGKEIMAEKDVDAIVKEIEAEAEEGKTKASPADE